MNNHDDRILHLLTQIGHLVGENHKNEMSSKLNDIKFNVFFKFSFYLFGLLQNFNPNTSENKEVFEHLFLNEFKYFVTKNGGPNIVYLDPNFKNPNFMSELELFFKSYFAVHGTENSLPFDCVIDTMNIVNGVNNMSMNE